MKTTNKILVAILALGLSAFAASAQDNNNDGPPAGGPPGGGQRGPGMDGPGQRGPGQRGPGMGGPGQRGQRPPPPAIIAALDANHDGVIDADEIANASAALKKLDKNGDGKLTPDEFIGKRPQGGRPPGGNNRGPDNNDGPQGPPPGEN